MAIKGPRARKPHIHRRYGMWVAEVSGLVGYGAQRKAEQFVARCNDVLWDELENLAKEFRHEKQ